MVNLSHADTFDGFVHEVRVEQRATTVVLPEYAEHTTSRVLETLGDVLRDDALFDPGWQRWTDRVFVIRADGAHVPLSTMWDAGAPWWARLTVRGAQALASAGARQALRAGLTPGMGGLL
jgi:hypothetical protein